MVMNLARGGALAHGGGPVIGRHQDRHAFAVHHHGGAAKAGVAALTVALGEELAKDDVLVNAVAPSIMDTPANRKSMPKADFDAWPKVEEVAAAIMFLASPENKVTRGAIVPVYGKF